MYVALSLKVKSFLKMVKKMVKKIIMSKNETYFVRLIFLLGISTSLCGEMTVGILSSIESNARQILIYQNRFVNCIPFGVIPLEKMAENGANPEECRKHIGEFYKAHPHAKYLAKEHLYLQQSYHFETLPQGCILYGNGPESLSEMLLRAGVALVDPAFDNSEWNGKLKKAQSGAQRNKIGLHDTLIQKFCIKEEK